MSSIMKVEPFSFTDSDGDTYTFTKSRNVIIVSVDTSDGSFCFLEEDIDKIIECLLKLKD